jgi:NO-binding membrane sensor protein with MHYT domain
MGVKVDKTEVERIGVNEAEIKTLKDSDERQWLAIEKLQNRLPIWATTVISLLTFFVGCTVTYAIMLAKLKGGN